MAMADIKPFGELEIILADLLISGTWRLKRALSSDEMLYQAGRY